MQALGFWLVLGPLLIARQQRHENTGVSLLMPGSLAAALGLMGTGIPERQDLLLGSSTTLLVNFLLALGLWRLILFRSSGSRQA